MLHIYQLHLIIIIDVPCDIERVTSRFMLSKNLYIYIGNSFPFYFLMLLPIINVWASH
uniref:Uncharacterized protein n=1 Tax=Amphimedon queenslandica TaxID=400682 RepID=A0A1X7V4P7_AMPQE